MKIGIIGIGNMGSAILKGLISSAQIANQQLYIYARYETQSAPFINSGVKLAADEKSLIEAVDYVILAIEPSGYSS